MGIRSQICYPAIICLLVASVSCSTVLRHTQPASTTRGKAAKQVKPGRDWPGRRAATLPKFTTKAGQSPVPLGVYGHCQVVGISHGKPNPLLLCISRKSEPVNSSSKLVDIDLTVDEDHKSRVVTRQHRLTIVELESARAHPVRGTMIYLGSIMGVAPPEQKLISTLRLDGWNVIACLPPFESFADDGELPIYGPDDIPQAAKRFANRVDQHLVERAYVAESAIAYAKQNKPGWLKGPTVVVGTSAGALALPTVVDRIGPVAAAVMIGGGANLPDAILNSSLDLAKPVMYLGGKAGNSENTRPLTDAELAKLASLAFKQIKFDPAYLAPVLDKTQTLLLLGSLDAIVPAKNGELLYEKLGKPELWKYPLGHNLLMMNLPSHARGIRDWINTKCPPKISPSPIRFEKRPRSRVRIDDNTATDD